MCPDEKIFYPDIIGKIRRNGMDGKPIIVPPVNLHGCPAVYTLKPCNLWKL